MAESTLKLDNDTNKLKTGNFGNSNASKDIIAHKTLSLWMSREEAQSNGLLTLFSKYNKNNSGNSKDRIDEIEYGAYCTGEDISKASLKDFFDNEVNTISELELAEQTSKITESSLKSLGINDKIIAEIKELRNNNDKKDLATIAKEELGIDISKCKTEEEKQKLIANAVNKKYSYQAKNKDSVYAQHLQRLRNGQLTESEKELLGGRDSITDEYQLEKFAQMATDADAMVEITKMFAIADKDAQTNLIKTMGNYNSDIQTGLLAIAVYSSENIETRKEFANLLINKVKLKLSDKNKENFHRGTYAVARYTNQRDYMKFVTDSEHFVSASAQTSSYMISDVAEKDKLKHNEITQEEYNNNYINVYAASAHMIQEASRAYQYVIDNANDENRSGTMDMLASTAYQIQDESERNKAINSIQNSPYYNDNTANKLNESFDKYISQQNENSQTEKHNQTNSAYITNPQTEQNNEFSNIVSKTFENNDEKSTKIQNEIINKTFSDLEEKNSTPERQRMSRARGIQLLNILIKENKIQGSIHEAKIINKLKSLPVQTLVTLMCSLNSNAQNYFVSKNIITERELMLSMNKADQRNLSDKIQANLEKIRKEATGRNLNIDYA